MTDKEILAELKKSYEYLYDIRENGCFDHCNGQMKQNINLLDNTMNNIEKIYEDFYKTLDLKDLIVPKEIFNDIDDIIVVSSCVNGDYDIYNKDNFVIGNYIDFITCGDLDYYWYYDEKFIDNYLYDYFNNK